MEGSWEISSADRFREKGNEQPKMREGKTHEAPSSRHPQKLAPPAEINVDLPEMLKGLLGRESHHEKQI